MTRSPARRYVLARWILLLGALVAELLGLTMRFDAQSLRSRDGTLAAGLVHARLLPEISIAVAAALLVAGWSRLQCSALRMFVRGTTHRRWWWYALLHLAVFGGFSYVSAHVFEGSRGNSAWMLGWLALAPATLGCWLCALAPLRAWVELIRRKGSTLLAAAGVGCLAWSAGNLTQGLWAPLGAATFKIVAAFLRQIYPEVLVRPDDRIVGVGNFSVEIAPHCSGFEGLGLVAVFLLAFSWVFRHNLRFPRALLLWPIGLAGMWLGNALRITALIVLGASWSPDVALGGFHSQAGWITFNLLALALGTAALRIPFFSRTTPDCREARAGDAPQSTARCRTAAYLVPFLAITATGMACCALQTNFDQAYPLKVLAAGVAMWCFRGTIRRLTWSWSWSACAVGTGVFTLWMLLDWFSSGSAGTPDSTLPNDLAHLGPGWATAWIVFRVLGSVITVPLVEELAFRGYLLRRWDAVSFDQVPFTRCSWPAIAISSVLFGLLHGRWFAGALAGLAYAVLLRRRGKFSDAVLAHAVTNAQIAATVLFTGAWRLWG
jgi:exosortase E/protease (VPEID-CTERM system)